MTYIRELLKRQFVPLVAFPAACLLLCGLYFIIATPMHSAKALLRVELGEVEDRTDLEPQLMSHVAAMTSDEVTSLVIDQLPPDSLPETQRSGLVRLFGGLRRALGGAAQPEMTDLERRSLLVDEIKKDLVVRRVRETAILEVIYRHTSPQRAADLANLYAETLISQIREQAQSRTQQALSFSQSRLVELRQAIESLFTEAQEIRSSLKDGRGGVQDLEARILQLTLALSESDQSLIGLQEQVRQLQDREDPESLKLAAMQTERGANLHAAFVNTQMRLAQMQQNGARTEASAQLERQANTLRDDLEFMRQQKLVALEQELRILVARRNSISADLNAAMSLINGREWSKIRIAEYEAGILENIYADHLRDLEVVQRTALATPVHILSPARPNPIPVWPQYKLLLVLALLGGIGIGAVIAVWREWGIVVDQRLPKGMGSQFQILRERWEQFDEEDRLPSETDPIPADPKSRDWR